MALTMVHKRIGSVFEKWEENDRSRRTKATGCTGGMSQCSGKVEEVNSQYITIYDS